MSGFGVNIEACIWKKVDIIIFKIVDKILDFYIQDAKEDKQFKIAKNIQKWTEHVSFLLRNKANISLDVTHPHVKEFQNNILSWFGPEYAEMLQKNVYEISD